MLDVEINNQTIRLEAERNIPLSGILLDAGIHLNLSCGGKGSCGRCEVILSSGYFDVDGKKVRLDTGETLRAKGCRCHVLSRDAKISVPPESIASESRILASFSTTLKLPQNTCIALDIGTTTLAAVLIEDGTIIARKNIDNHQRRYGDNVISRISFASENSENLKTLQQTLISESINVVLRKLCAKSKNPPAMLSLSGNTVMTHLFFGLDVESMGYSPFTPEHTCFPETTAAKLKLDLPPECRVVASPAVSGFVGGDIVAGLAASGITDRKGTALFVDIGTNCEVALLKDGKITGCAAAAGPAFEGAGTSCGRRAGNGAIEHLQINDDLSLKYQIIGNEAEANGMCATAMIDFLAVGRYFKVINEAGRYDCTILEKHSMLGAKDDEKRGNSCIINNQGDMLLYEKDIEALLKAKAAVGAGIKSLLEYENIQITGLDHIYLAGAFAEHLNLTNAIKIALLPDVPLEKYIKLGNCSLAGAIYQAAEAQNRNKLEELSQKITSLSLNELPQFQSNYIDALFLP